MNREHLAERDEPKDTGWLPDEIGRLEYSVFSDVFDLCRAHGGVQEARRIVAEAILKYLDRTH